MFFLRSDNDKRTQMSGQGLFSGLYPETTGTPGQTNVVPFWTRDEGSVRFPSHRRCCFLTPLSGCVRIPALQKWMTSSRTRTTAQC